MSSTVDSAATKAKEVAVEDFNKAKELAHSAAKSGAYLYPIRGIFYFISHRSLWKPLLSRLMPTVGLYLGVTIFMFLVAYLPQLAVLVFVNGPLAAFTTILLTLSESSTLSTVLAKTFLIQDALVDTFDGTLLAKNEAGIVSEGRQLKSGNDPIAKLGKLLKSPFEKFTPKALVRYVMYLPLNFIPVVGTVMFVFIQGRARGKTAHTRYFQLKKMSKSQQQEWLHENAGPYTSFGLVATLLELVPIASIVFSFTNTVGAALWAADIEAASSPVDLRMTNINTTAPKLREAANSANKSE